MISRAVEQGSKVDYQLQKVMAEPETLSTSQTLIAGDETTKQLTLIWQELLGLESIGPDENYFDLGGDSILAVQLFVQIERSLGVKLSLATLFDAPTIRELARTVACEAPTSNWSPLVPIQPYGSRPPLFCMHGAGGNVLIYRDLSRALGDEQPFYGLQAQGLDGTSPFLTRIEDMAALYVREIQRFRPHGPYLLAGYCGGGTIAYEVAQQLRAKGEHVSLVALFDTMNWCKLRPFSKWSKAFYYGQRLAFHLANFVRLDSQGRAEFLRAKARVVRARLPVWWGLLQTGFGKPTTSQSALHAQAWKIHDAACMNYVPKPYPGMVVDFQPCKQYRALAAEDAKWGSLALDGQEVCVLPVYPAGMLLEPFVQHLANALKQYLDRAIPA